jgi:hypothetical protein
MLSRFKNHLLALVVAAIAVLAGGPQLVHAQAFSGGLANLRGSTLVTLTGYATPPTGTVQWRIEGQSGRVTLWAPVAITGTSNATSLTVTGLPYTVTPQTALTVPCFVTDNAIQVAASCNFASGSGTITVGMGAGFVASGFTATGTKGLQAGFTLSYPLY